jgi:hypothetical protein
MFTPYWEIASSLRSFMPRGYLCPAGIAMTPKVREPPLIVAMPAAASCPLLPLRIKKLSAPNGPKRMPEISEQAAIYSQKLALKFL